MDYESDENPDSTLEWVNWMDGLIIEDAFRKEKIILYPYSDFKDLKVIGVGSNGNVCKATIRSSRKNVVLKPISLTKDYSHKDLINEIKRYRQLEPHGNILKLYGIAKQDQSTHTYLVVFEYSDGGSLRQFLKENSETIGWHTKLQLSKQLVGALMWLHGNDIVHGHLSSSKVLVHKGKIKLNPFGIVRRINESRRLMEKLIGPVQYADPRYLEILQSIGCKKSVDIYSLGIILWEISSSREPYKSESKPTCELIDEICNGRRETILDEVPREYSKILQDCWHHDERRRPNVEQIFEALDNVDTKSKSKLGEIVVSHDKSSILKKSIISANLNANIESNPSKIVRSDPPFIDASDKIDSFLKNLFEFFNEQFNKQNHPKYVAQLIKKYIEDHQKNPAKILIMMLRQKHDYLISLIGLFYQFGIGTLVDSQIALEMYSQVIGNLRIKETPPESCEINSRLISEFSTGFMYLFGTGVEQDQTKAFQIFSKLSNEGFALAKAYLGECFERGYGTNWNAAKALELYSESAETGSVVGKTYLDYCYMNGIGIPKDTTKGFDMCLSSAMEGNVVSQNWIGNRYFNGVGTQKDTKRAFEFYLKAAEAGNEVAQYNVGLCYMNGNGVVKDECSAFEWFLKSAENGDTDGQYMVGWLYKCGQGTQRDVVKAIHWLAMARDNGNGEARKFLNNVINQINFFTNYYERY